MVNQMRSVNPLEGVLLCCSNEPNSNPTQPNLPFHMVKGTREINKHQKLRALSPGLSPNTMQEEVQCGVAMKLKSHGNKQRGGVVSIALREHKARLYIIRRCIVMLLCYHD
ncbi:hypothetical protein ACMD2_00692 [Ananas comosus]|uniref:Uncharacterized protein n=1 Tax=Ananas comosus TaxID=4615 RepID=A0A199VDV4_ANACO|nr:hypothetical protein ACMD2_00692 [Ananas comosus]